MRVLLVTTGTDHLPEGRVDELGGEREGVDAAAVERREDHHRLHRRRHERRLHGEPAGRDRRRRAGRAPGRPLRPAHQPERDQPAAARRQHPRAHHGSVIPVVSRSRKVKYTRLPSVRSGS